MMRAPRGISSPASESTYPLPSKRSCVERTSFAVRTSAGAALSIRSPPTVHPPVGKPKRLGWSVRLGRQEDRSVGDGDLEPLPMLAEGPHGRRDGRAGAVDANGCEDAELVSSRPVRGADLPDCADKL